MKRLVLVDGNALLHRAYHATPPLTTSQGELINAVYGFTSMILRSMIDLEPDFIAVAWDEKGPTFRHQAYSQYKGTRGPADEGLTTQYKRVHEVVRTLNIPEFSLAGYEADDLIGTLAKQATKKDKSIKVVILTGDRDIMQLIDAQVEVLMPKKTINDVGLYGVDEFTKRFGFTPIQLIDYKALAGDPSDNIPGVQGIGDVSATKLIQQFASIEKIYRPQSLKTLPERIQKLLAEGAESAAISKGLATIDTNAPIKLDLSLCRVHYYDHKQAVKLFEELEFKSLIPRLPKTSTQKDPEGLGMPKNQNPRISDSSDQTDPSGYLSSSESFRSPNTTDLDLAVVPVLEKMSKTGILIDLKFLGSLGQDLKGKLSYFEKEIFSSIGHEFNLNSPKQLSEVLFDELKLPVVRKTKTGRSTDEATLTQLKDAHPAIPSILQYRQLFKLISTYIDALPKFVGEDGRIHSTFNVEGAATGRLSSQDPNLQNIPIKGEMGAELRKAFISPRDKILLGADYSQIELRILAHLSQDPNLKKAFEQNLDIHTLTASRIFKIPIDKVSRQQRSIGKTMNFATLYGQGPRALSKQLGVDFQTARVYIAEYFEQFPKVKEWIQKVLEKAYENGYAETIWGRKRFFPELKSQNKMLQSAGERAAVNHPIQGTQADMIKKAMVEIDKSLSSINKSCSLILQIHDELLFECEPSQVESIAKMVKEKMENALTLSIPIVTELKTGPSWAEMTELKII